MATMFLAVGHGVSTNGAWDSGTTYGDYKEADLMFEIARYALPVLRKYMTVHSDFDTGNDRNVTYCVRDANNLGVDLYVSLHCDWEKAGSGTLPIIYYGASGGRRVAECINASVNLRLGLGTRGILERDDWEVADTNMTACIFETGSIKADLNTLLNAQAYGQAVAFGILDYFGIAYTGNEGGSAAGSAPSQPQATPTNPRGFTSIFNSNYYLSYGDGPSEAIKQFQRDCNFCGYFGESGNPLIEDGLYGSECVYACKCIQRWNGITVDGEFGEISDICLMNEVAMIQEALNNAGFECTIDGAAGTVTIAALKAFQKAKGLEPDGICGSETRAALGIK